MSREKANYRPILEDILGFTSGERMLNIADVARYTGRSRDWCKQHIPFNSDNEIHAVALAGYLA